MEEKEEENKEVEELRKEEGRDMTFTYEIIILNIKEMWKIQKK